MKAKVIPLKPTESQRRKAWDDLERRLSEAIKEVVRLTKEKQKFDRDSKFEKEAIKKLLERRE